MMALCSFLCTINYESLPKMWKLKDRQQSRPILVRSQYIDERRMSQNWVLVFVLCNLERIDLNN